MPDLLELKWMLIPFLACLVISLKHVYLGVHVISRKVIFVDLALAQIAAVGATYATTLGYDPQSDSTRVLFFSLAFTFVGAVAFAIARMRKEKVPQEAFIGIIYAAASALAILILSKSPTGSEELKHMLVGDVLLVSAKTVMHMAVLYGLIAVFHVVFRRRFLQISLDPEAAEAQGVNIRLWDILFYTSFGVVITHSVAVAGVLLVFSYLVVPAVVAQMWTHSVRGRLLIGWAVAIVFGTAGIVWSFYSDFPTGPSVVLLLSSSLVISGIAYYLVHSASRLRAAVHVAGLAVFAFGFFFGLSQFRKPTGAEATQRLAPVDLLLRELNEESEAHQLDAVRHLADMHDPRIVPALAGLLKRTNSEQVVEAIAEALGKQNDPRAVSALQAAAQKDHDPFLQFTIARAQIALGDKNGYRGLLEILKDEDAGFARQQAIELLEAEAKRSFGYQADKPVRQNSAALQRIEQWLQTR